MEVNKYDLALLSVPLDSNNNFTMVRHTLNANYVQN